MKRNHSLRISVFFWLATAFVLGVVFSGLVDRSLPTRQAPTSYSR